MSTQKEIGFASDEICIDENVDILQYPKVEHKTHHRRLLVIGDMHGNALKFVNLLIKHNRLAITPNEYEELAKIYQAVNYYISYREHKHYKHVLKKRLLAFGENDPGIVLANLPDNERESLHKQVRLVERKYGEHLYNDVRYQKLTGQPLKKYTKDEVKDQVARFNNIIQNAKVISTAPIFLLGDDMRERGTADDLTLSVYEKLFKSKIPYSSMFSNHGLDCIRDLESKKTLKEFAYEHNEETREQKVIKQYHSFNHMALLAKRKIISEDETTANMRQYWLQKLKLLEYSIDKTDSSNPTITLFMHAPIGLKTIAEIARLLNVTYAVNNIDAMAKTIDQINAKFSELVASGKVYETSGVENIPVDHGVFIPFDHPLARLAWNRQAYGSNEDDMPSFLNGFHIRYVHGHHHFQEIPEAYKNHTLSLDDGFGKEFPFIPEKSITLRLKQKTSFVQSLLNIKQHFTSGRSATKHQSKKADAGYHAKSLTS